VYRGISLGLSMWKPI